MIPAISEERGFDFMAADYPVARIAQRGNSLVGGRAGTLPTVVEAHLYTVGKARCPQRACTLDTRGFDQRRGEDAAPYQTRGQSHP